MSGEIDLHHHYQHLHRNHPLDHQQHTGHGHHQDVKRFGLTHRRTVTITTTKMGMKLTIIAGNMVIQHS